MFNNYSIIHAVDIVLALVCIILCLFIAMMTLFGVKMKTLQEYKTVFLINAFADLLYGINNVIVLMSMTFGVQVVFTIISNPLLPTSLFAIRFAVGSQVFCMFLSLNVIPLQFMFRYGIVRGRPYSTMQISYAFLLILFSAIYHGVFTAMSYLPRNEKYDVILHQVLETNESETLPPYIAGDLRNPGMIMQLVNVTFNTIIIYGSILYFVQKSKTSLTLKCEITNTKTLKIQRQMTIMLYAQAIYPIFSMVIPCTCYSMLALVGVQSKYLGDVIEIFVHSPPAFNCISIIVCIPAYRRVTQKAFNFARSAIGSTGAQSSIKKGPNTLTDHSEVHSRPNPK